MKGRIHHGIKHSGNKGRVAHETHNPGAMPIHAGKTPHIIDSGAKAYNDLAHARSRSHPSRHEVRVSGGVFSGKVRH